MADNAAWRIELCGGIEVSRAGRPLDPPLPARQGRLVFAYLVLHRSHPVARDDLIDVLWPGEPPASPDAVLSAVLTRLRQTLGGDILITGHGEVQLRLPASTWVDIEAAAAGVGRARLASSEGRPRVALELAHETAELLEARLLPEFSGTWLEQWREDVEELRLRSLELIAEAALTEELRDVPAAQRAAARLIRLAPFREAGYAALMRCHAAQADAAGATKVFDRFRVLLRDELGTTPSPGLISLNERLLRHEEIGTGPRPDEAIEPPRPAALPPPLAVAAARPLVGRDAQRAALIAAWREHRPLVCVSGEAGIGKTHLVAHAANRVHDERAAVLYGRCDEDAIASYQPFAEALRRHLTGPELTWLRRHEPAALDQLAGLIPELEAEGDDDTASGADRARLFEAVGRVLERLCGHDGLLLVLEDLHWADQSTLLLLRHVLRLAGAPGLTVIATFRPVTAATGPHLVEMLGALRREQTYDRIELAGLGEDETAALLLARTGTEARPRFARRLCQLTSGNPFFIVETLRTIDAPGARSVAEVADLPVGGIPAGVRDVILGRLARTGPQAAEVLRAAAVIGRRFDIELLTAVLDRSADELLAAVEELIQLGLVTEAVEAVDSFVFSHDLVRETQYEELSASRRTRLHQRVARALERREAVAFNELARHTFEARHLAGSEKAIAMSIRAARRAHVASAHEEAIGHYRRALVAMDAPESGADRRGLRCDILLELGDEAERIHDIDVSRSAFRDAAVLARGLASAERLARAAVGFARWQRYGSVDTEAISLLRDALGALPPDPSPARLQAMGRLAIRLDSVTHRAERERLYDDAVMMARSNGDLDTLTSLLPLAPHALPGPDRVLDRLALAEEALSLPLTGSHQEQLALAHIERFLALLELSRLPAADAALQAASHLVGQLHLPWFDWQLLIAHATRAVLDGRDADAQQLIADARRIDRDADPAGATETWAAQSFMLGRARGRFDEIDIDAITQMAGSHGTPLWHAMLARTHDALGRTDVARRHLRLCLRPLLADPPGREWLAAASLAGETATDGAGSEAAELRRRLIPYATRIAVADRGVAAWGPVSAMLGGTSDEAAGSSPSGLRTSRDAT